MCPHPQYSGSGQEDPFYASNILSKFSFCHISQAAAGESSLLLRDLIRLGPPIF